MAAVGASTTAWPPSPGPALVDALEGSDVPGISMLFSFERQPMGTAGGVRKTSPYLDGTFIVLSADVLADVDLGALVDFHRGKGADATMALTTVENPTEYGIVGLDADDRIERFLEKPAPEAVFSNLINAGIYVLEPHVMEHVPEGTKFDFSKNLFPTLLEAGHKMYGHKLEGLWMDIGRPRDLLTANGAMVEREGGDSPLPEGFTGTVQMGPDVVVGMDVEVVGPAMIGPGVRLGDGARVVRSFLHTGVVLEPGAVVEDSLVLRGTAVGPRARLVRTIMDAKCTVGEGATLEGTVAGTGTVVGPGTSHVDAVLGDE